MGRHHISIQPLRFMKILLFVGFDVNVLILPPISKTGFKSKLMGFFTVVDHENHYIIFMQLFSGMKWREHSER